MALATAFQVSFGFHEDSSNDLGVPCTYAFLVREASVKPEFRESGEGPAVKVKQSLVFPGGGGG